MTTLTDNSTRSRFEWIEEGKLSFADYQIEDGVLILPHVESDPALRGKGSAGRLMTAVLELARQQRLKVRPICGYAIAFIERHPAYQDLLMKD